MERTRDGEDMNYDSPLLQLHTRGVKKNKFLRTPLVTRDIREAIVLSGLNFRSICVGSILRYSIGHCGV